MGRGEQRVFSVGVHKGKFFPVHWWRCCLPKRMLECTPVCIFVGLLLSIAAYHSMLFLPDFSLTFLFHQFQTRTWNAGRGSVRFVKMRFWFVICQHFSSHLLSYASALHKWSLYETRRHLKEPRNSFSWQHCLSWVEKTMLL